jgi:hypothetical protein
MQSRLCISCYGYYLRRRVSVCAEPKFVNLLRSPRIDSQPGEPVRQPYLTYRHARRHRLAESILLGSFNVCKFGLDIIGLLYPLPVSSHLTPFFPVLRIRIRIHRIHMCLGLQDPDPDPLVRGMDPDPDPSIIMQK